MKRPFILLFAYITVAVIDVSASEKRVLMVPSYPIEQKFSEAMGQQLAALEKDGSLVSLSSWPRIGELPNWVFVPKKREIAYVFDRAVVSDGYRYAVIWGRKKGLIVVRAGGIAGTYEIFVKPRDANPASEPTSYRPDECGQPCECET